MAAAGAIAAGGITVLIIVHLRRAIMAVRIMIIMVAGRTGVMVTTEAAARIAGTTDMMITGVMAITAIDSQRFQIKKRDSLRCPVFYCCGAEVISACRSADRG
jgi:hypothetical protein